jgi:hypothetical protein
MTRYALELIGPRTKREAADLVARAPHGTRVEFKGPQRTTPQNSRMWAMLSEFALQLPYDGQRRTPDHWKKLFLDDLRAALDEEIETLPSLDGSGRRVPIGNSSSDLSKEEMSMMIELMFKFGSSHGVVFADDDEEAA